MNDTQKKNGGNINAEVSIYMHIHLASVLIQNDIPATTATTW